MKLRVALSALTIAFVFSIHSNGDDKTNDCVRVFDPFLWLEKLPDAKNPNSGKKATAWVQKRNKATLDELTADPLFPKIRDNLLAIYTEKNRIPFGTRVGDDILNFWTDATHVKGILRRAKYSEYESKDPQWETLLDIDKLAKDENRNWVYGGNTVLPSNRGGDVSHRALIKLIDGGGDAFSVREFDLDKREFVADGFSLPANKSRLQWLDADTILVATDFGNGRMSKSGYPLEIKAWKRNTPLASAKLVFRGGDEDTVVSTYLTSSSNKIFNLLVRYLDSYRSEYHVINDDLSTTKINLPDFVQIEILFKGEFILSNRKEWKLSDGRTIKAGSLISATLDNIQKNAWANASLIFETSRGIALNGVSASKDFLVLALLDNVKGRLVLLQKQDGQWTRKPVPFPNIGMPSVATTSSTDNKLLMKYSDFLTPFSSYRWDVDKETSPTLLRSNEKDFDSSDMVATQHFSISKDGTRIPYFLIHKKDMQLNGRNPTLLYGYGGFEVSLEPSYLSSIGKEWVANGGVYVLANIRGGSEFGPEWHQAALRQNRQRAYDDFISVAEDLIRQKITSPKNLGVSGGSNGGLLVGVFATQRPDLCNAVICAVPLLDMLRYQKLFAGSSWMAEYGDPEDPEMAKFIAQYSPYQNVRRGVKYPTMFFSTTSTDNRVHPGHARKMAAKLEAYGNKIYYSEEADGGHGGSANSIQRAEREALKYVYLWKMLSNE